MKILYIVPHLSTGGMPEYLRNKIEKIKSDNLIWILEKNHEKTYNTIRKRIEKIIGKEQIITWGSTPLKLIETIKAISPDIIHFEETCESFVDNYLLDQIFVKDRKYKIIETFHDSSLDSKEKIYLPDKFLVVSPWQVNLLLDLNVPIEVIEHELVKKTKNREHALTTLSFDKDKKNIVQIGIFTPRKNQKETIELARMLPHINFHFVGTLAENYAYYWNPLMNDLPQNVKIWGERDDVDLFYQAADLVYLPSLHLFNDKETSPLVIKETLLYETKLLMRNLDIYVDMYQESDILNFIKSDDKKEIAEQINEILYKNKMINDDLHKFNFSFDKTENRIDIKYNGPNIDNICTYIKDIDSGATIYCAKCNYINDYLHWFVPIPIVYNDFYNNINFGGFLIELRQEDDTIIKKHEMRFRFLTKPKHKCRLHTKEPIFINYEQFFQQGIYDDYLLKIKNREVCVDVGANVGLFTEFALLNNFEKVISIEPNPQAIYNFKKMHCNNEKIKLYECAISSKDEDLILSVDPENTTTGSSYTKISENTISVKTKKLSEVISDYDKIDLLKMDIEGGEYDVLLNESAETLQKIDNLLLEYHYNNDNNNILFDLIIKLYNDGNFNNIFVYDNELKEQVPLNYEQGILIAYRTNKS